MILITFAFATGQRLKEGCYDAAPITCDDVYDDSEIDFDADKVCKRIVFELFPQEDYFMMDTEEHPPYLNSVEAGEEFCSQIRRAYSRCIFCMEEGDLAYDAIYAEIFPRCGGLPSMEEILQDNENYTAFRTPEDIQETCQRLEEANTVLFPERRVVAPGTLDLARKKVQITHLCPGYCDGGCFDEDYPPSCDPDAFPGPFNESLDSFQACNNHIMIGFLNTSLDITMNISEHVDYLRFIPGDSPQCDIARQAYASCVFCAESLCFDESHPASCEAPDNSSELALQIDYDDADYLCKYTYFHYYGPEEEEWNIPSHPQSILMGSNNPQCEAARSVFHQCYWCAPNPHEDFCVVGKLCDGNVSIPDNFENTLIPKMGLSEEQLDCELAYDIWKESWDDPYLIQGCYEHIDLHQRCPMEFCEYEDPNNFDTDYLGTTTTAQRRALIWVSRVSAMLSFCGACYILHDILRDQRLRKNVYHQLLTGMAIFDVITALSWSLATFPVDSGESEGYYVEGAMGTEPTCTAQAFFIQLGFTSVFYNVSLGVYYALVVAYGWREFQLRKIRLWMHILPLLLGVGLALGAIPSYHWFEYGCHILPTNNIPVLVFVVLPLGISIAGITASMFLVYWKVRKQSAASKKWSFGVGSASKLEQAVFWQCLCYVLAFYISWPILFAVYLFSIDENGPFGLALTVAFLAPLQGFNNWLVYVRGKRQSGQHPRVRTSSSNFRQSLATMMRLFDPRSTLLSSSVQTHGTRQRRSSAVDPSVVIAMDSFENEGDLHLDPATGLPAPIEEPSNYPETALEETVRSIVGMRAESKPSLRMKSFASFDSFADESFDLSSQQEKEQESTANEIGCSSNEEEATEPEGPTPDQNGVSNIAGPDKGEG